MYLVTYLHDLAPYNLQLFAYLPDGSVIFISLAI